MSSNTPEQKRRHKEQQAFRDRLKQLRDCGWCDWPYEGAIYRVTREEFYSNCKFNALVKMPRQGRGYKVIPNWVGLKDSKYVLGFNDYNWTPQDRHILGTIVGEVYGPRK